MRIYFKQAGFTVIELLVVIALFSILTTFAIPSFLQMTENAKVKTATDSILTGLQLARGEAVKRNTNVQFDFRTASSWTVCVSPAVSGNCPAAAAEDDTTIESRAASDGSSSNVTINANGDNSPYVFNSFGGLISPATTITIDVGNDALSGSRDLRVVVGIGGATKTCDPALDTSGTDPRRCS